VKIVDDMPESGIFLEVFQCNGLLDVSRCMWSDDGELLEYVDWFGEWCSYIPGGNGCEVKYIVKD